MRRSPALTLAACLAALVTLTACSQSASKAPSSASATPTSSVAPGDCAPENLTTRTGSTLTIAVPARVSPPYFVTDDPTKPDGDPASGKGYEAALLVELAQRLGFTTSQITWVRYAKDYESALDDVDLAAGRIPITIREGVDFTTPVLGSGGTKQVDIGLALRSGDPLLQCLDDALAAMTADGTLDSLTSAWLNPTQAPVLAKSSAS